MENDTDLKELSFEEAIEKLETIVRELESGRTKLDDAVAAYEQAVALKNICESKLKAAELKIEKLDIDTNNKVISSDFIASEE